MSRRMDEIRIMANGQFGGYLTDIQNLPQLRFPGNDEIANRFRQMLGAALAELRAKEQNSYRIGDRMGAGAYSDARLIIAKHTRVLT